MNWGGNVRVGGGCCVGGTGVSVGTGGGSEVLVGRGASVGSLVGARVVEGTATVHMGKAGTSLGVSEGELVILGMDVGDRLGVLLATTVAVLVDVEVPVFTKSAASWHASTPANPRLYASSRVNNLELASSSSSGTWLPSG